VSLSSCLYDEYSYTWYHSAGRLYAKCHYVECHYAECLYAECHYAECHYAECHYAECHCAECHYAERHSCECRGGILTPKFLMAGGSSQSFNLEKREKARWLISSTFLKTFL
jgi:hypothetical protein